MRGEFLAVTNMLTGNLGLSHLSVWGGGGGEPSDEVDEADVAFEDDQDIISA